MWLSRVKLVNFKSYREQVFDFPRPAGGRNLILIGGVNGYGKTTLLEAIYVGLYGEEAVNHQALTRAGLKALKYGQFLESAFYRGAPDLGEDRMEVTVDFEREDGGALSITRKWFFKNSGKFDSQKVIVQQRARTGTWSVRPEGVLSELYSGYVTDPWLAPFFFFDGEKIAELADANREAWVLSGLESLLGVVLVKELRAQLTAYIDKKNREVGGVDEERVDELRERLEREEESARKLALEIETLSRSLAEQKSSRDDLMTRIASFSHGVSARTVAEVAEALSRAEHKEEENWRQLREICVGPLALQLIRRELYASLEKTLQAEAALAEWEHGKERWQPRWEQFRTTFFASQWLSVIAQLPGARESLESTLAQAWDSLFNPRDPACAESNWHSYLQAQERAALVTVREHTKLSAERLRRALATHADTEREKKRLQLEQIQVEGAGDNREEIARLNNELKAANDLIAELDRKFGAKENEQRAALPEIDSLRATYKREQKKLIEGHPERKAAREAGRVLDMIDDLLPELFDMKLNALSNATTRIFRALHQKDQVHRIEIDRTGKTQLFSREGTEIDLPKSSGESQLFVLSLVGALAEVTGYRVPLIVDTPLARLSEKHCENLLDYWTGDPERQVILLAQDKEIGEEEYRLLDEHIAKTYLLKHWQVGHGIGKTEALPDAYFGATL